MDGFLGLFGMGIDAWNQNRANEENYQNAMALNDRQFNQQMQLMRLQNQATRELYSDLYSPAAKRKQLEDAGLSIGLMYGGNAGGQSSTQGAGGNAPHTNMPAMQPLTSQLGLQLAEIRKLNAETQNIEADTKNKGTEGEKKELEVNTFMENFRNEMEKIKSEITKNLSSAQKDNADAYLTGLMAEYQLIINQYEPQLKELQIEFESGQIDLNAAITRLKEQEKKTQIALEENYKANAEKSRAEAHKTYKEASWVDALSRASIEESKANTAYLYAKEAVAMAEKTIMEEMHELTKQEKEEAINLLREQVTQERFETSKMEFSYHYDNVLKAVETIAKWRTAGARQKNANGNLLGVLISLLKYIPK